MARLNPFTRTPPAPTTTTGVGADDVAHPGPGPRPGPPVARVRGHHRSFGNLQVLRSVDLDVAPGEFVALLGRSGCGKSTLLRSLAHLDPVPAGEVEVTGRSAVAFQEPRLLPWRSVHENVALALLNGEQRAQRHELAAATLREVGLEEKAQMWPRQLSGGQAQRASLARALVSNPDLLLLDEPFSALDALTRIEMHQLVIQLWRRHAMAVLIVTHDVDEALALADRVVVLDGGRVADTWSVDLPRSERTPEHPEIAPLRAEVLQTLGIRPTPPNPHRTTAPASEHADDHTRGAA